MNRDFDHLLADHLLSRERATRGREEEVERGPADRLARAARAARSGGGLARGGNGARGGALLRGWFR